MESYAPTYIFVVCVNHPVSNTPAKYIFKKKLKSIR